MFALASDLLHDVRMDIQGPHLVTPDRCVPSRSARCPLGRGGTWPAGLALHGGPDAASPLASKAAIDVTAGHLPVGIAHGLAPSPGRHRGPAGRREEPHARGVRAEPSAAGSGCASLSVISPAGSLGGRADGSLLVIGTGSSGDGTSTRPGWASPESAHAGGVFRGRPRYPKAPPWLTGLPCGRSPGSTAALPPVFFLAGPCPAVPACLVQAAALAPVRVSTLAACERRSKALR
jgi:hypothetical protein